MCVVSVEGQRGFPAACTLPVADGMKIQTESSEVNDLRKSVMEMLIAEHPNGCLTCHRIDICGPTDVCLRHVSVNDRCVTCPKNERCELKDTVRYLGMSLESPLNYKYRQIPLEVSDPFYDRDYNLCIVCGVFIHWQAEEDNKIYEYNYAATKESIERAMKNEPSADAMLAKRDTAEHPFYKG